MIQLRDNLAWVRAADGTLTPYDGARLARTLDHALQLAGRTDSLLSESIAAALYHYANEACPDQILPAEEIAELVVAVLTMLGLPEVVRAYRQRGESAQIRLDQIAGATTFELGFYRQLDTELRAAAGDNLLRVRLSGLRACVMQLRGARRWGDSCRVLADEIVAFIRERLRQARSTAPGALNVEVLE